MANTADDKCVHTVDVPLHPPPNLYAMTRIAILSGVLFLSGIGALIFETLWLRLSGLAFGNSVWSAALILSSFMAGLALGNAIAASSKVRRWRPLHLYALLEVLVAFFGCTIVFGLTLPVLIEDPILRRASFGRAIGLLYGSNTLGAVVGAVLGEGYLIAAFGLRGTSLAAGLAVCTAAGIALLTAGIANDRGAFIAERTFPLRLEASYRPPWRLLLVSFGTGCILLGLEVIWFRFLRLYVPSSSTAFAVMLAVVLAGIGLGGVVSGALHRCSIRPNHLLSVLLLLAAIATLLSYSFFPPALVQMRIGTFDLSWRAITLGSVVLMFPAALLSGILFPSIVANVQSSVGDRMN